MTYVNQPQDLVSRLRRVEARLDDLFRRVGLSSAVIRRGGLSLLDDAYFEVVSADGDRVAKIGGLGTFGDGTAQQGTDLRYNDGRSALTIWNPGALNPADQQFLAVWNGDQIVMSTDAFSGFGLARPWLPISFERERVTEWPATTAAAYEGLVEAQTHQHHPWIEARISVSANPGTSGDARLVVAGAVVGDPVAYGGAGSAVTAFRSGRINQVFGTLTKVSVEARRTAGAGSVFVKVDAWWRQS